MRNLLKFSAYLFGAFVVLTGSSSCEKKEKIETHECCSFWDDGDFYKYCEDDPDLGDYSWDYYKAYMIRYYNADCKDEPI